MPVCEIMAHLCAIESPFRARLVRITLQENPSVAAIADHMTGGYDLDTPAAILLDTFSELRAGTVAYLEKLPPAGLCVRRSTRTLARRRCATRWKPCWGTTRSRLDA